jgi:hypothetical protein
MRAAEAGLVVGSLVTWRVSHLLVEEDGPGHVVARARSALDRTPLTGVLDCFGCASVWVGALTSVAIRGRGARTTDVALGGLAMSGAAFLVQKAVTRLEAPDYLPEPEVDSDLVRVAP